MQVNISSQILQLESSLLQTLQLQKNSSLSDQSDLSNSNTNNQNFIQKIQTMMKIFVNSLKLNEKLYNSITQKEAKISSGTNSFVDFSLQVDAKIQDALKRTKQLYEDTVHQNQKARFLLQQFISPIREQLRSKVDQTTFTLQMKMLLDEYDIIGHQITYDNTEQQLVKQQKRKSVNSETLSFLRDKILPVISSLQIKLNENIEKGEVMSSKLQQFQAKTRYLQSELNLQRQILQQIEKKNIHRINEKFSDQFADKKLRQTIKSLLSEHSSNLEASVQKVSRNLKNVEYSFGTQLQQFRISFSSFSSNQKAFQTYLKTQVNKHGNHIEDQANQLKEHQREISVLLHKVTSFDQNKTNFEKLSKKVEQIKIKMEKGEFNNKGYLSAEDAQTLMKRLNMFTLESSKLKTIEKNLEQKNLLMKGQLQTIRDILSKKANFSDILLHIENKVDKQEFKELKQKIIEQRKGFGADILNNSLVIKETEFSESSKRRKHIKSRSFFSPSSAEKGSQVQNEAQHVKRFKLGFTNQLINQSELIRKQYSKTQHLRKSIQNNNSATQRQVQE